MKTIPADDFFARRVQWETASNPLTHCHTQLLKENVSLLDLTCTNPTQCGFKYPSHWFDKLSHGSSNVTYNPTSLGLMSAREAVVAYYGTHGHNVSVDQILLVSSSSEAYSNVFRLLCNQGNGVLIPTPSYPLFSFLTQINDVVAVNYTLIYEDERWKIDLDELQRQISSNTKAVLIVNPNNPTGSLIHRDEYEQLISLCQKYHLALICDEVFIDYPLSPKSFDVASIVEEKRVLTFVINGLSKTLALPQMKLSWMHVSGPSNLVREAMSKLEIVADTFLSVNTPVQLAIPSWLPERNLIQDQIRGRCQENLVFLKEILRDRVLDIEAGWSAMVHLPCDDEQYCLKVLQENHVVIQPGYLFDVNDQSVGVLSLLTHPDIFQQGVRVL